MRCNNLSRITSKKIDLDFSNQMFANIFPLVWRMLNAFAWHADNTSTFNNEGRVSQNAIFRKICKNIF